MPHSFGYRARTRHLFARKFRAHGTINTSTFLQTYHRGQIVDIAGNGAVQKGMPHKFYHGKTGVIWNVTPRAVGVVVNKLVGNRVMRKRIHVRIEHIKHSKCRAEFLLRVKDNDIKRRAAQKEGKGPIVLKRQPAQPRPAAHITTARVENLYPLAYAGLYQ